jgi:hypothetical protein
MDEALSRIQLVNTAHIVRKRSADSNSSSTKRRCFDHSHDLERSTFKSMNAIFQSPDPTEVGENGDVISEKCDMMEDVQNDSLVDIFAQVAIDKEYDHIVWNGDEVCRHYRALALNNDRDEEELSRDIGYVWRLLPLFVTTIRSSSEMIPEILQFKAYQ